MGVSKGGVAPFGSIGFDALRQTILSYSYGNDLTSCPGRRYDGGGTGQQRKGRWKTWQKMKKCA